MSRTYISFDWAIKKMLRQKANFGILEGFLSELLGFTIKIQEILESEANQQTSIDKFDRVDILVKSDKEELMLIEVQYAPEDDYFQRMVYGIFRLITKYITKGQPYGMIRKAYSINIIYFSLGQGNDYLYEYRGEFFGINENDVLLPTQRQKEKYDIQKVADIFPKYYIIRVNNFKKNYTEKPLEEWIYFLQNSEIPEHFKAQGIEEAREKLQYEQMSPVEKQAYQRFVENRRIEMAVKETARDEGFEEGFEEGIKEGIKESIEEGIKKGIEKGIKKGVEEGERQKTLQVALNLKQLGIDIDIIIKTTGLSRKEIEDL